MRLLFDILHPTHVHFFKALIQELLGKGHEVRITLRENAVARELLDGYALPYEIVSREREGAGRTRALAERGLRLWRATASFRPHFMLGARGPTIAPVGRLRRLATNDATRVIVFCDTELLLLDSAFVQPLADYVCTPDCFYDRVRGHHLAYSSYPPLAYLHPERFTPDANVVRAVGLDPESRYFVARFTSSEESRDGRGGISPEQRLEVVRKLAAQGKLVVSSESRVEPELEPYALRIPATALHHVLAFASLLVGDSASMTSEAACLGVPAAYVATWGTGYTDEQERRYGLVHGFTEKRYRTDWPSAVLELAQDSGLKARAKQAVVRLWSEKIDLTSWMLELIEREFERHLAKTP